MRVFFFVMRLMCHSYHLGAQQHCRNTASKIYVVSEGFYHQVLNAVCRTVKFTCVKHNEFYQASSHARA